MYQVATDAVLTHSWLKVLSALDRRPPTDHQSGLVALYLEKTALASQAATAFQTPCKVVPPIRRLLKKRVKTENNALGQDFQTVETSQYDYAQEIHYHLASGEYTLAGKYLYVPKLVGSTINHLLLGCCCLVPSPLFETSVMVQATCSIFGKGVSQVAPWTGCRGEG